MATRMHLRSDVQSVLCVYYYVTERAPSWLKLVFLALFSPGSIILLHVESTRPETDRDQWRSEKEAVHTAFELGLVCSRNGCCRVLSSSSGEVSGKTPPRPIVAVFWERMIWERRQ